MGLAANPVLSSVIPCLVCRESGLLDSKTAESVSACARQQKPSSNTSPTKPAARQHRACNLGSERSGQMVAAFRPVQARACEGPSGVPCTLDVDPKVSELSLALYREVIRQSRDSKPAQRQPRIQRGHTECSGEVVVAGSGKSQLSGSE